MLPSMSQWKFMPIDVNAVEDALLIATQELRFSLAIVEQQTMLVNVDLLFLQVGSFASKLTV